MLNAAVNVTDHFIRVDRAVCCPVKVCNSVWCRFQTLELLLADRVVNRSHIALNVSLGKSGHRLGPFFEDTLYKTVQG